MNFIFNTITRYKNPNNLIPFEKKVYSQNGEDGILAELLRRTGGDGKRTAVEFGVEDGAECNTRLLREKGWNVIQLDGNDDNPDFIKQEFITAENINKIFKKYDVPYDLDILSIDIDSNDLWVWKALNTDYRPRIMVVEYNATIAPSHSLSVKYDPKHTWDGSNYFGASLLALYRQARQRGYSLVYCDNNGVNSFFVRDDLVEQSRKLRAALPADVYRAPRYGVEVEDGIRIGHLPATNEFVEVDAATTMR